MTQEEYEQEQREIARLEREINALIAENQRLSAEIDTAIENIRILHSNVVQLHKAVEPRVRVMSGELEERSELVSEINQVISEMSDRFFTFKNLSTASKNVTQYTDEYYTKFSYYNNVRRITLGYVIGLDTNFVDNENIRSIVEKAYLQNTKYWLAYAMMAIVLWSSNEQEAAIRALEKAMFINPQKASLFFMLINLRFTRQDTAYRWFIDYMGRVNVNDLEDEWQYILQAYLSGAFGTDEGFQAEIGKRIKSLVAQADATTADLGRKVSERAYEFADTYLHSTAQSYSYLKGDCPDYPEMLELLSCAEKNALLVKYYCELLNKEEERSEEIAHRVEEVLYSLISSYDDDELEVMKKIRQNETIIAAKGNLVAAKKSFDAEFREQKHRNFGDMMLVWAFAPDSMLTPQCVRIFSVATLKKWIIRGYERYVTAYRQKERGTYRFQIDGCELTASEHDFSQAKGTLEQYYEANKLKTIIGNRYVQIELAVILAGLLTLVIMGFQLSHGIFSPMALVIGLLLVLIGVFLLWRQIVSLLNQIQEKKRLGVQRLQHGLEQLGQWRKAYHQEDAYFESLIQAIEAFERG